MAGRRLASEKMRSMSWSVPSQTGFPSPANQSSITGSAPSAAAITCARSSVETRSPTHEYSRLALSVLTGTLESLVEVTQPRVGLTYLRYVCNDLHGGCPNWGIKALHQRLRTHGSLAALAQAGGMAAGSDEEALTAAICVGLADCDELVPLTAWNARPWACCPAVSSLHRRLFARVKCKRKCA